MVNPEEPRTEHDKRNRLAFFVACGATLFGFALFVALLISEWNNPAWQQIVFDHFQATWGVPIAVVGAATVVAIFRTVEGPIRFEVVGFKFEGASGPIVMWAMVFWSLIGAVKLLW